MHRKNPGVFLISMIMALSAFSTPAFTASLPTAKPNQGLVVFYRMSAFAGKAVRFNVNHAEGTLGQLLSGTYLYKHLDPGVHNFFVQGVSLDGQDSITVNVEAGKTYYIKGEVLMGWPAGRPKFRQMSESEALADLENL